MSEPLTTERLAEILNAAGGPISQATAHQLISEGVSALAYRLASSERARDEAEKKALQFEIGWQEWELQARLEHDGREAAESSLAAERAKREEAEAQIEKLRLDLSDAEAAAGIHADEHRKQRALTVAAEARAERLASQLRVTLNDLENAHAMICATTDDEGNCGGCKVSEHIDAARMTLEREARP